MEETGGLMIIIIKQQHLWIFGYASRNIRSSAGLLIACAHAYNKKHSHS